MKTSIRNWLVGITTMTLAGASAFAGNFTKGNLVVLREGDGSAALSSTANPISLIELTTAGVAVQTNTIPSTGVSALTHAGSSGSEGFLTTSPDGKTLVLVGYNVNAGMTSVSSSNGPVARRSVASVNPSGVFTIQYTSTSSTFTGNIRSGTTDGLGNYWAAFSSGGIGYLNTATQIQSANARVVNQVNGNLLYDTTSVLNSFTGFPTATASSAAVVSGQTSVYDFAMNPAGTILYMADDGSFTTANGGVRRFDWSGTAWVFSYKLRPNPSSTSGATAIAVDWSGASPVIYGTSAGSVFVVTDSGSTSTGTVIATPPVNMAFRGIRFAPSGAPVVTSAPSNLAVNQGDDATFSVSIAAGADTATLTYQWYDNNVLVATHTTASLSDSYTISAAPLSENDHVIHVVVNNTYGSQTTSDVILTVNATSRPSVLFTPVAKPSNGADNDPIYLGQTVTIKLEGVSGTTPLTYYWSKNGANLISGTSSANPSPVGNASLTHGINGDGQYSYLTLTGVTAADAGTYSVIVSNYTTAFGSATTNTDTFADPLEIEIVINTPAAPSIVGINPNGSQTNNAGANLTINVGASDQTGSLTYQWKRGAANLSNGTHVDGATVAGATSSVLSLTGVLGGDAGVYHCIVSNTGGSTDSATSGNTLALTVNDPFVPSGQPKSQTVRVGGSTTLSISASGTGMTYQWRKNGQNIGGANSSSYLIASALTTDAGSYDVVVNSSLAGSVTSSSANLVVASTTPVALSAKNLVLLHIGDGLETLSANGNSVYVEQYQTDGSLVSSYAIDNTGANAIGLAPNSTAEDALSRAGDGSALVFGGYNTPVPAGASIVSGSAPRAAVTIGANGAFNIAVEGAFYSGSNIRSVGADGLGHFWSSGSAGGTILLGSPTVTIQSANANTRVVTVQNGNLYYNFNNGTQSGTQILGFSGMPTTASTPTLVINTTNGSIYDYSFSPDGTVLYLANDGAMWANPATQTGDIERWDLVAGSWGTQPTRTWAQGSRSLTVDWSGRYPVVYATGAGANGSTGGTATDKLFSILDDGVNTSVATIASAAGGTFRGVKFAPGTSQTITFGAIADKFTCSADFNPGATASSGLAVTYSIDSGNATIVGGLVHITGTGAVTVRASQAGNSTYSPAVSVTQTFNVNASTANIIVTGANPANVECHGSYTDAGATATDSCGNAISVTPSGSVDANTVGSYTVTYTAGTATATRVVTVADTAAPVVTVVGSNPAFVQCHGSYVDAGATASDVCAGNVSATVTITGVVDANTPGSYTLTYSANDGSNIGSATRVVNVVDSVAPVVTLNGPASMTVECHGSFSDPGASASDACDTSVTSATASGAVNVNTLGSYTLNYSATDASGNTGTATRVVQVVDTTGPVITLNPGDATTCQFAPYVDPGATATDACSGVANVTPSGTVDTSTVGTYTLTYTATDVSLNSSVSYRVVDVVTNCGNPFVTGITPATTNDVVKGTATFKVTAYGSGPFAYYWYSKIGTATAKPVKNNTTTSGATTDTLVLANLAKTMVPVNYYCVVSNANGLKQTATSPMATLVVYDAPALVVTAKPSKVVEGNNVVFTAKVTKGVTAQATPQTPQYAWYYGATQLTDNGKFTGTSTATMSVKNIRQTDAGSYTCVVTTTAPVTGSASAGLTVNPAVAKSVSVQKPLSMTPASVAAVDGVAIAKGWALSTALVPQVDVVAKVIDTGLITAVTVTNSAQGFVNVDATTNPIVSVLDKTATNIVAGKPGTYLATVTLVDGTNNLYVVAEDETGSIAVNNHPLTLYYMGAPSALVVQTNGTGKVTSTAPDKIWGMPTPATQLQLVPSTTLEIGHVYSVKATAGPKKTFVQWDLSDPTAQLQVTPGTTAATSTLQFVMKANLTITAKFSDGL